MNITGKLTRTPSEQVPTAFTAYRVRIGYTARRQVDRQLVDLPASVEATPDAQGRFTADLPERSGESPLELSVVAPDGTIAVIAELATGQSAVLTVPPFVRPQVAPTVQPATTRRVTGRAMTATGEAIAPGTPIVLLAGTTPGDESPIAATDTNTAGYFFCNVPLTAFTSASALIAGDAVKVPLDPDARIPGRLILVVAAPAQADDEASCDCEAADATPHAPEPEDVVAAPEVFSADASGCVSFTKPNRTIEEFSFYKVVRTTDPAIQGMRIDDAARLPDSLRTAILQRTAAPRSSPPRAGERPPAQGAPPAAPLQALRPSSALKLLAVGKLSAQDLAEAAEHDMLGELAELVQAISLLPTLRAPLSVKHPIDWDETPTAYQATTIAHGHVLRYKQIWRADGYSLGDLLYSLPLAPGQKRQVAIIDWTRRDEGRRDEQVSVRESLRAELAHDRDIQEVIHTALTESVEGGSRSTVAGLAGGVGGVFQGGFYGVAGGVGTSASRSWQDSARDFAAQSGYELRDLITQASSVVRGMRTSVVQTTTQSETAMATTEVVANHNHCHALTMQYFEVLRHLQISTELVDVQECLFVPLLMSPFTPQKALRWRHTLEPRLRDRRLARGFAALARIAAGYEGADVPAARFADEAIESIDGRLTLRFELALPLDIADEYDEAQWEWLPRLLPSVDPKDYYKEHLKGRSDRGAIFRRELGPRIVEAFVERLRVRAELEGASRDLPLVASLAESPAVGVELSIAVHARGALPVLKRVAVEALSFRVPSASSLLPANSVVRVLRARFDYRTDHFEHDLVSPTVSPGDLADATPIRLDAPLAAAELRSPRDEDKTAARDLLAHLAEYIEHYHRVLWLNMDQNRRYMLLDGFFAPNADGRSLASVVENRVLAVVGNSIVMPVAPGWHLDPTHRLDKGATLLDLYRPVRPTQPVRVSLPTSGVFAEAVMGSCNSCEPKDDARFWRWEESPIDEPTAIAPPTTDSRTAAPPNLQAQALPAPIVAFQNAPAAPDPTGLAAAIQAVTNPNVFRDATGLAATQANAAAALSSSLDTAKAFGLRAAELKKLEMSNANADKNTQRIRDAVRNGDITPEQGNKLMLAALRAANGSTPASEQEESTETTLKSIGQARKDGAISDDAAASLTTTALTNLVSRGTTRPPEALTGVDLGALMHGVLRAGGSVEAQEEPYRIKVISNGTPDSEASLNHDDFLYSLGASVGLDGVNRPVDVAMVKARLRELGYDWLPAGDVMDTTTIAAIRLFQSIVAGRESVVGDGRIDVPAPSSTSAYAWLQAENAPRWTRLDAGSRTDRTLGFFNYDRTQGGASEHATDWLIAVLHGAARRYAHDHLSGHPDASVLEVNDLSLAHGGDHPSHKGHETGILADLRLPRTDGASGDITHASELYDRDATRAMLQAFRAENPGITIYFNDPTLIAEGLCRQLEGHDNHFHIKIVVPTIGEALRTM